MRRFEETEGMARARAHGSRSVFVIMRLVREKQKGQRTSSSRHRLSLCFFVCCCCCAPLKHTATELSLAGGPFSFWDGRKERKIISRCFLGRFDDFAFERKKSSFYLFTRFFRPLRLARCELFKNVVIYFERHDNKKCLFFFFRFHFWLKF